MNILIAIGSIAVVVISVILGIYITYRLFVWFLSLFFGKILARIIVIVGVFVFGTMIISLVLQHPEAFSNL